MGMEQSFTIEASSKTESYPMQLRVSNVKDVQAYKLQITDVQNKEDSSCWFSKGDDGKRHSTYDDYFSEVFFF